MELTDRQLKIIAYIYNHPQGVNGEQIADAFSISLRTLQNEIKELNHFLDKSHPIYARHKGYYLDGLAEKDKKYIAYQLQERTSIIMPVDRVLEAMMFLMFEKKHISMEQLALKMNVSKSTVFNLFQNSIVLQRFTNISRTKGISTVYDEKKTRNELAKIFDVNISRSIKPELADTFNQLSKVASEMIYQTLSRDEHSISGEELHYFNRHIVITALRTKFGFHLPELTDAPLSYPLVETIAKQIEEKAGIKLTPADIDDCSRTLEGLSSFSVYLKREDIQEKFEQFIHELKEVYGLSIQFEAETRQQFLTHIEKLLIRLENGQYNINFKKREINRRYPMAAHLIVEVFEKIYGIALPDTEITLLALYLAREIYRGDHKIPCIVISEASPSIAYHLKEELLTRFSSLFSSVEIYTNYQYILDEKHHEDALILTTSQPLSILKNELILVRPFLEEDDLTRIEKKALELIHEADNRILLQTETKYLRTTQRVDKEYDSLKAFLDAFNLKKPVQSYEFVTDLQVLLYPTMEKKESFIDFYYLEHALTYRNKRVKTIIFSNYNPEEMNILRFYEYLRYLMNR